MTTALEGGNGSASRPVRYLPPGKTRYPLYRRLCGPQDRSGQLRKISPPPGFDPRTAQPTASRYTDCAIPAYRKCNKFLHKVNLLNIPFMLTGCWQDRDGNGFILCWCCSIDRLVRKKFESKRCLQLVLIARIYHNARVYHDARIYHDGRIYHNARSTKH